MKRWNNIIVHSWSLGHICLIFLFSSNMCHIILLRRKFLFKNNTYLFKIIIFYTTRYSHNVKIFYIYLSFENLWCIVLFTSSLFVQELAENHCVNSETLQPKNSVELRQQEGSSLSYTAIDMLAKLVVLLVKVRQVKAISFSARIMLYFLLCSFKISKLVENSHCLISKLTNCLWPDYSTLQIPPWAGSTFSQRYYFLSSQVMWV